MQENHDDKKDWILGIFKPIKTPSAIRVEWMRTGKLSKIENKPIFYYTAEALPDLLKVTPKSNHTKTEEKVIRFLLTTDNKLVLACEGYPRDSIPAHFQMSDFDVYNALCLTAGNAFFNAKGELCGINHKSGDFRPPFDTLQFLLPALIKLGIPLADEIRIEKLDNNGGFVESFQINSSLIKQLPLSSPRNISNTTHSLERHRPATLYHQAAPPPAKKVEDDPRNEETKYLDGIKILINLLPRSSSTKKKYLRVIEKEPAERQLIKLQIIAEQTVEKHKKSSKTHPQESTAIHMAICQATLATPYAKSDIARLAKADHSKDESTAARLRSK